MKTRIVLPRPGRCGWAVAVPGHSLPEGLEERTPVFITNLNGSIVNARDSEGREWRLARQQVDCGLYFVTMAGGWIHETSARARNALQSLLKHHLATVRAEGEAGRHWDEKASRLLWILQRSGKGAELSRTEMDRKR